MSVNSNAIKKIDDQIKFLVSDDNQNISNENNVEKKDNDIEILEETIKVNKLDDIKNDIELLDDIDESDTKQNNEINDLHNEEDKFLYDEFDTRDDIKKLNDNNIESDVKNDISSIDDDSENNTFLKYYIGIVFLAIILIIFIYFLFR